LEAHSCTVNGEGMFRKVTKGLRILWRRLTEQGIWVTARWAADHLVRIVTGAPIRHTSEIARQLHVGGQHRERGWVRLEARGVSAVVNLRIEFDDAAAGVAGERHLYLPTEDDRAPSLEQLREGAEFIREVTAGGEGVYVHCGSGVGRAPTLAAAYLVSTGLTPMEAWDEIRRVRPFIRPTAEQIAQLERFAEEMGRRSPRQNEAES